MGEKEREGKRKKKKAISSKKKIKVSLIFLVPNQATDYLVKYTKLNTNLKHLLKVTIQ